MPEADIGLCHIRVDTGVLANIYAGVLREETATARYWRKGQGAATGILRFS